MHVLTQHPSSMKMIPIKLYIYFLAISYAVILSYGEARTQKLFREYIGADSTGVKLCDVPINSNIEFHFILSFAIDYTTSQTNPDSTNGDFNIFWDSGNITSYDITSIKANHSNVKLALSIGGDTVGNTTFNATFNPVNVSSWVNNAVNSLTEILKEYHLDGIDIDYEHFNDHSSVPVDPQTFADCIGQLIFSLKEQKLISFASIAPFDDDEVEVHYTTLWNKYGWLIDYVNFQFYAYDNTTTVPQFLDYFEEQRSKYEGAKILASIGTDDSGGLSPENGFFEACKQLKDQEKLHGIFIWSADDSLKANFTYEKQAQYLLAH